VGPFFYKYVYFLIVYGNLKVYDNNYDIINLIKYINGVGNLTKESYVLENSRLKVIIDKPGCNYKGSRFDHSGFIRSIVLDGIHTFCVPESLKEGEGSGGLGICNEFGIFDAMGYTEAKVGEFYPKIGVGLIKKEDDKPYNFYIPHEFIPYIIKVEESSNTLRFFEDEKICAGYGFSFIKTIEIEDNFLKINYNLTNLGSKTIETHEYCHNFFGMDNSFVGENYELKFPFQIRAENVPDILKINENKIIWGETPKSDFYCRIEGYSKEKGNSWELTYKKSNLKVKEYDDFKVKLIALWGSAHVISPEVFVDINIKSGESMKWNRKYEFIV